MKKYIPVIMMLFCSIVFGQNKYRSADKNFESLWYIKAAQQYETIIKNGDTSKEVLQKVGDAYYFNTDMEQASKWYGELFSKYENTIDVKYTFRYIHALEGIGNYRQAKALMKIHGEKLDVGGFKVEQLGKNDKELDELLNQQPQFYISHLSINSKVADFGTAYYKNKIVFASSRDSLKLHTRLYKWNNQPYLNLFIADTTLEGTDLKNIKSFSENINTKYHEAVVAFNKAGDQVYFTRNNYTDKSLKRDEDGMNHLKMYHANLVDDVWVDIKEIPFNSEDYSVGQPALSADEKKLYFVSDMPGSIGATDIFVVDIHEDGTFSNPRNIGPTVNTSGREMFPFLTNGTLYFASDGHLGFGGLDVFESKYSDVFSKPINLGEPLNSRKDDFAYIVNEETQRGYVSSNRDGGIGDDDIYSFERIQVECNQNVVGSVANELNGIPEDGVSVFLMDKQGGIIAQTITNSNGEYIFDNPILCNSEYKIRVEKETYDPAEKIFVSTKFNAEQVTVPLGIKKRSKLIVEQNGILKIKIGLIYFDLNKSDIRYDAEVEINKVVFLLKEYPEMTIKIEAHTDSRSSDISNMELSDRRAKATRDYIVSQGIEKKRIESAIGYGESKLINKCKNSVPCSDREHDINRRSEFIITNIY
ncbi:OmpA family protein [Cellulophaga sp. Z1A5H]|uniref:OmpA family protein n=1 Tax=Cellulophaga sp. Z1A5H TaxID=2687291 RepID=UPI0013FDAA1B|nr:OmpA family protein [Cellulophaga sp. Z1A5H]